MSRLEFNLPHAIAFLRQQNALRCLSCNYDIRGQVGRMRRCPECGALIDILSLYSAVLREAYPVSNTLTLAYSLCALPLLGLLLGICTVFIPGAPASFWTSWLAIAAAAWVSNGLLCGVLTRFEPGWWQAFLSMTVVALEVLFLISLIIAALAILIMVTDGGSYWPAILALGILALHASVAVILRQHIWVSHDKRAKQKLRVIQIALDERRGVNRRGASFGASPS